MEHLRQKPTPAFLTGTPSLRVNSSGRVAGGSEGPEVACGLALRPFPAWWNPHDLRQRFPVAFWARSGHSEVAFLSASHRRESVCGRAHPPAVLYMAERLVLATQDMAQAIAAPGTTPGDEATRQR